MTKTEFNESHFRSTIHLMDSDKLFELEQNLEKLKGGNPENEVLVLKQEIVEREVERRHPKKKEIVA